MIDLLLTLSGILLISVFCITILKVNSYEEIEKDSKEEK